MCHHATYRLARSEARSPLGETPETVRDLTDEVVTPPMTEFGDSLQTSCLSKLSPQRENGVAIKRPSETMHYQPKFSIFGRLLKKRHSVQDCSENILENQLAIQQTIAWPFLCWLLRKPTLQTHGIAKSMFSREKWFLGYFA